MKERLLEGEVILATGAGSGIGRAAVEAFIAAGARVGILERSPEKVAMLRKDFGEKVVVVEGDATKSIANRDAVSATVSAFGKIDTLACFVGIFDMFAGVVDLPDDKIDAAFDEVYSINVKSTLFAVRAALDELVRNEGRIVLTVSPSAFYAGGGGILYTSSKFAVRGLVCQLAHELGPKVRVNAVAPGGTVSDLRGPSALGQDGIRTTAEMKYLSTPVQYDPVPAVHAAAYVQLASREFTNAMSGEILRTDGGLGVRGIGRVNGNAESMIWS